MKAAALLGIASMLAVPPPPVSGRIKYVPTRAEREAKEKKRAERKAERQRKTKARRAER